MAIKMAINFSVVLKTNSPSTPANLFQRGRQFHQILTNYCIFLPYHSLRAVVCNIRKHIFREIREQINKIVENFRDILLRDLQRSCLI